MASKREQTSLADRQAFSLAEFAKLCGKSPTWAHRLVYAGKLKVVEGLGCKLVTRAEVERVLSGAQTEEPSSS